MAITLASGLTGSYTGGGLTDTWGPVGPGAGVTEGQIMVVIAATDSSHSLASVPEGWTQLGTTVTDGSSDSSLSVIAKRATAGDSGEVTVVFSGLETATMGWFVLDGVDETTMLDVAVVTATGTGTARDASITTVTDGAACVMINSCDPSATIDMTFDEGITEILDVNTSGSGHIDAGLLVQPTAGLTSLGGDWSTADNASTLLAAFRPAAAGGGGGGGGGGGAWHRMMLLTRRR